jgi:hypothetical protein
LIAGIVDRVNYVVDSVHQFGKTVLTCRPAVLALAAREAVLNV